MISSPSGQTVLAVALGAATGCCGYYFSAAGRDGPRSLLTSSVLMGGLGYCIGVLTGSRAPVILATTLAATTLIAAACRWSTQESNSRIQNCLSLAIPMAAGMTFLSKNELINRYCALAMGITVIAIEIIDRDTIDCISRRFQMLVGLVGSMLPAWPAHTEKNQHVIK